MRSKIQLQEQFKEQWYGRLIAQMLRDLQPQRRQAQGERQLERQQVESELPLRGRPKVSHFSSAKAEEFVLLSGYANPQAFFPLHQ